MSLVQRYDLTHALYALVHLNYYLIAGAYESEVTTDTNFVSLQGQLALRNHIPKSILRKTIDIHLKTPSEAPLQAPYKPCAQR